MYAVGTYSHNSTWLAVGGVLLLLLIIFLVWLFWYYWGCSTISVSQQSFTVRADKHATIKPCNGYVQRLAFCAKEDVKVTVTITPQGGPALTPVDVDLTADTVHWWQLSGNDFSQFSNFDHVTISVPSTAQSSVQVIAEIVSTNICDCKKSCASSCSTSKCSTSKCTKKC